MLIVVASNNIFRRELTSYTLLEAGHAIREIFDLHQLGQILGAEPPLLIIADISIAEAADVLGLVRAHSRAPLIWIGRQGQVHVQDGAIITLDWPHRPDELLTSIERLKPLIQITSPRAAPALGPLMPG